MTSAEFNVLLHTLGLNDQQAATFLGVRDRTVRRWRARVNPVPEEIAYKLRETDGALGIDAGGIVERIACDDPQVAFQIVYADDSDLARYAPVPPYLPPFTTAHRAFVDRIRLGLGKRGIPTRIIELRPEEYESWRLNVGLSDSHISQQQWAEMLLGSAPFKWQPGVVIGTDLKRRADSVLETASHLDEAISHSMTVHYFLGQLMGRPLSPGEELHAEQLAVVEAALIRDMIVTVAAIFDPANSRGGRASIGQVVEELKDREVLGLLTSNRGYHVTPIESDLEDFVRGSEAAMQSDAVKKVRHLRVASIAHVLKNQPPPYGPTRYDELFAAEHEAQRLVAKLFAGVGRGKPSFVKDRQKAQDRATGFWNTYFAGMRQRAEAIPPAIPGLAT